MSTRKQFIQQGGFGLCSLLLADSAFSSPENDKFNDADVKGDEYSFARMLVAECPAENRDAARMAQFINKEVIPFVEREQGFRSVSFFLNETSGKFFSITFYQSADDLRLGMESIKELRSRALSLLGCNPISMESLKVIAMKTK